MVGGAPLSEHPSWDQGVFGEGGAPNEKGASRKPPYASGVAFNGGSRRRALLMLGNNCVVPTASMRRTLRDSKARRGRVKRVINCYHPLSWGDTIFLVKTL